MLRFMSVIFPEVKSMNTLTSKMKKASEMNEVIERIIHHVNTEWGIKVMLKDKTKMPEAKKLWAGAYTEQWNLPLSKLNK